jgi:hypothetical protein
VVKAVEVRVLFWAPFAFLASPLAYSLAESRIRNGESQQRSEVAIVGGLQRRDVGRAPLVHFLQIVASRPIKPPSSFGSSGVVPSGYSISPPSWIAPEIRRHLAGKITREALDLGGDSLVRQVLLFKRHVRAGGIDERTGFFSRVGGDHVFDAPLGNDRIDKAAAHGFGCRLHGLEARAAGQFSLFGLRHTGASNPHSSCKLGARHPQGFPHSPQPSLPRRLDAGVARGAIDKAPVLPVNDGADALCQFIPLQNLCVVNI